ncbi:protein AAR2 homolog [Salvia splendens]|uniref:protein AAR2 homolog n=1 Tax=Salvia splendens TaxID=180675 RepID=UPI001C25B427|nr:protein AAR2 homolog [Salvia splendens]
MDADTALELVKKGATLLALDVPPYTLFGIDTQMFSVGPNFKGVKMIPPGTHFIYYSSCNREGSEFSPIIGFFINASSSEVIVRRWDQKEERLVKVLEEEEDRYSDAVKRLEFDMQLGPYALNQYGDWIHLSNFITKDTLERLEPIGGDITIACESEMFSGTSMEKSLAEQLKNSKFSGHEKKSQKQGCYYTTVPRVVKQKGIYGEDITSLNLDKTHLLETILIKEYGGDENALLAELQFAFIAFLMGQSLQAFVQWKLLVSLLLGCTESPLRSRSSLFTKFMKVIYYQLKFGFQKEQKFTGDVPQGVSALLEESWLSSDSFLHRLCKDFFSVVFEAPVVDGDLLTWTRRLRSLLEETIGWNFEENGAADGVDFDEEDEYAPVVVNLDEGVF